MTITEEIIEVVREMPGLVSAQIVELMPHVRRQSVYSTLNSLYMQGRISRDGARQSEYKWNINPNPAVKPVKGKRVMVSLPVPAPVSDVDVEQLRLRVIELEAWKADVIRRYPETAIPAATMRARSIVAAELQDSGDSKMATEVRDGLRDGSLAMRLVIKMLEGDVL